MLLQIKRIVSTGFDYKELLGMNPECKGENTVDSGGRRGIDVVTEMTK